MHVFTKLRKSVCKSGFLSDFSKPDKLFVVIAVHIYCFLICYFSLLFLGSGGPFPPLKLLSKIEEMLAGLPCTFSFVKFCKEIYFLLKAYSKQYLLMFNLLQSIYT